MLKCTYILLSFTTRNSKFKMAEILRNSRFTFDMHIFILFPRYPQTLTTISAAFKMSFGQMIYSVCSTQTSKTQKQRTQGNWTLISSISFSALSPKFRIKCLRMKKLVITNPTDLDPFIYLTERSHNSVPLDIYEFVNLQVYPHFEDLPSYLKDNASYLNEHSGISYHTYLIQ